MNIAILHYSVPPVVGGVEAVIHEHTALMLSAGFHVTLIAGAGEKASLPVGTQFIHIPAMDSREPRVEKIGQQLEAGGVPEDFERLASSLASALEPVLQSMDQVIVHNVLTKHFNLPLTAALARLLDQNKIQRCIAWCHDFTWTSPHSRSSMHPGYPWDLLRTYRKDVTYVTVSQQRQAELAGLFACPLERIHVVYNGVNPADLFSLSVEGQQLIERLDLMQADLVMLMPVRITQAKNIEFALQVTASLKDRGIQPRLVVTGPPDPHDTGDMAYYQGLLDLRKRLGVEQEARFIYQSGSDPQAGYTIGPPLVSELYRACDVLFMPSHREGFGMPILEAGLVGIPIFSTAIPAAEEIGEADVQRFLPDTPAGEVAGRMLDWVEHSPTQRLRVRIRKEFTWKAIFRNKILPLLRVGGAG